MSEVLLKLEGVHTHIGAYHILHGVDLAVPKGQLTMLLGRNGAGKTTYFNLISGQIKASAGSVRLNGVDISALGAPARAQAGLGRAFQLTNLFPNLTVRENVRLAVQARAGAGLNLWRIWSDRKDLVVRADEVLETVALADKGDALASSLPHGDQRKLEVGILMALEPQVFMFDEPTAGMSVDEVPVILNLIRQLKADKTKTILLVEHKMDVVRELSDRIIVLHNGELVADGDPATVIASPVVQQAYLGINPEEKEEVAA